MRATIDVREERGFFSVKWIVDCRVELTELEYAAIKHGQLGSETLYYDGPDDDKRRVTLSEVLGNGGVKTTWTTLSSAQRDRAFIEDQMLPKIKSLIVAGQSVGNGPRVIEL